MGSLGSIPAPGVPPGSINLYAFELAESFAETSETGAMPSLEGSCPRGMKTNQATNPPPEKGQEDEMKF